MATSDIPPTGGDELATIHIPTRHLSRVEDALRTFGYRLVDRDGQLTVASLARPPERNLARIASGTGFHRMSGTNPTDLEIITAFRECSGIAGEKLMDDRTRKGIGAVGKIYTSLTVMHATQAES